nr:MAG TPA: hypothetical protein [Caudoviricetes sp.]DAL22927.1 MAG TPA_asm: hypothetical protein [Caudoviricetes sp.]
MPKSRAHPTSHSHLPNRALGTSSPDRVRFR